MSFLRACLSIVSLAAAGVSVAAGQGWAAETLILDLNKTVNVDEFNRSLKENTKQDRARKTFNFGFDIRSGPLEDARQYLPFLDFLSRSTGYHFKLRFTPKGSSIIDNLGTGKIHFAAVGAVSFLQARETYGVLGLTQGVNNLGMTTYQSMIVVSPESPIKNLAGLKDRRLALGSISSTQGHLIPRIVLARRNITLKDLAAHKFTGSHQNCANAVINGTADACGMQDTMAKRMAGEGLIRILHVSQEYPSSGIAANRNVPSVVLEKVYQALLAFDPLQRDKDGLHNWHRTEMPNGFRAANTEAYTELQSWLLRLGFLGRTAAASGSGGRRN
jgi:phosphonate transport system substrate-binding protein